jgi:hypothetical protein
MVARHLTDSIRNVWSWAGVNVVVAPGGTPRAVFRRPLTVLQISAGIRSALIYGGKKERYNIHRSVISAQCITTCTVLD